MIVTNSKYPGPEGPALITLGRELFEDVFLPAYWSTGVLECWNLIWPLLQEMSRSFTINTGKPSVFFVLPSTPTLQLQQVHGTAISL